MIRAGITETTEKINKAKSWFFDLKKINKIEKSVTKLIWWGEEKIQITNIRIEEYNITIESEDIKMIRGKYYKHYANKFDNLEEK